jgi:collagenase-like PrtC family protease
MIQKKNPPISTFCSTEEELRIALDNNVPHIIIEHSDYSTRSFHQDAQSPSHKINRFKKLTQDQEIQLSFNCDFMLHHHHISHIKLLTDIMIKQNLHRYRVQDMGMIPLLKEFDPNALIDLAPETGFANSKSLHLLIKEIHSFVIPNEVPFPTIQEMTKAYPSTLFEIQVQGPLLIQYAYRRFSHDRENALHTPTSISSEGATWIEPGKPNRAYTFLDNKHGHFMYLYFHRCLLKQLNSLATIPNLTWLIDSRGELDSYLKSVLTTYKNAFTQLLSGELLDKNIIKTLSNKTKTKMKPGFFNANQTDNSLTTKQERERSVPIYGKVLDTIKKKQMTVELYQSLDPGDAYITLSPSNDQHDIHLSHATDLLGNRISQFNKGDLIILPWKRKTPVQSIVTKRQSP